MKYSYSFLALVVLVFIQQLSVAQSAHLTSLTASQSVPTAYATTTLPDSIFVFCTLSETPVNIGSLTAYSPTAATNYTHQWDMFNSSNQTWGSLVGGTFNNVNTSTISNLPHGRYRVVITGNGTTDTLVGIVYVSRLKADILNITPSPTSCTATQLTLNGLASSLTGTFTYPGREDPTFLITPTTSIQVCLSANHTFVSDLGYYLIGPPACGSPVLCLTPHPQVISAGNNCCCHSGDNISNLCFSTAATNPLLICNGSGTATAAVPLTGTFAAFSGWGPIMGCPVGVPGWSIQIWDCIGGDVGNLTNATLSFSNGVTTINYSSGAINAVINDNSCSQSSAATYTVPLQITNYTFTNSVQYAWSSSNPNVSIPNASSTLSPIISPAPTTDTYFFLTVVDNYGCSKVDTMFYQATNPMSLGSVVKTATSCNGTSDGSFILNINGGRGPKEYSINGGANYQTSNTFSNLPAGNYFITVRDSINCLFTTTVLITQPSLISTQITSTKDAVCYGFCDGQATAQAVGGNPPYQYLWGNGYLGNPVVTLCDGTTSLLVIDSLGCTDSIAVTVGQPDQIVVITNPDDTICVSNSFIINTAVTGGNGIYTYDWKDTATTSLVTVAPLTTSIFYVYVTDSNQCPGASDTTKIFVREPLLIDTRTDTTICLGDSIKIYAFASGGDGNYNFTWSPQGITTDSLSISPINNTIYFVTLSDGCSSTLATDSINIGIDNLDQFWLTASNPTGCIPFSSTISLNEVKEGATYDWDLGNGTTFTGVNDISQSTIYQIEGCYNVSVIGTTIKGCKTSAIVPCLVEAYPVPLADFSHIPDLPTNSEPLLQFYDASVGATGRTWYFGTGRKPFSDANVSYEFISSQEEFPIVLVAYNQYGCKDTVSIIIPVVFTDNFYIPNSFTPFNNDGLNTTFGPIGDGLSSESYLFQVYDRWGGLVFESRDKDFQWNGRKFNTGDEVNPGVYNVLIQFAVRDGEFKVYNGIVNVF